MIPVRKSPSPRPGEPFPYRRPVPKPPFPPLPLKHREYPWETPKEKFMTVCIAAACDNGRLLVTATDGLLSAGDATSDVLIGKMLWLRDWLFMYAGIPSQFNLIIEEIEGMSEDKRDALSRRNIQKTVRAAYRRFSATFSSRQFLDPYDMTMEEFKKTGLKVFGEQVHGELARAISQQAAQINEQILVVGWGRSPHAVMIYEIGPTGTWLHTAAGFAAIGSGGQMAQSMLLQLGQARHSTLSETLFNVACAKFSAEKSSGLDVGQTTTMHVGCKRTPETDASLVCGEFLTNEETIQLRELWDVYLRPRIPDEAYSPIQKIAARIRGGKLPAKDVLNRLNAVERLQHRATPKGQSDPLPTTADPSLPQPSPESPGGSDES